MRSIWLLHNLANFKQRLIVLEKEMADMFNDKVLQFFASQALPMLRILADRGSEYCGKVEHHNYELYLAINDFGIDYYNFSG